MFIYIYNYKMGNEINVKTTIYSNFKHKKHAHTKLSPLKKLVFPFKKLVKKLTGCEVKSWS